jgi:uncharacterized protein (DUF2062 family)
MIKEFFRRHLLPYVDTLKAHPNLQFLGKLLHDPNLWHINRHSLANGMAVGTFAAFIPLPFQMLWAALLGILVRGNLPLAVFLVWLTNPLTVPPLYYVSYKLGAIMLNVDVPEVNFGELSNWLSSDWWLETLGAIWAPWLVGLMTLAILSSLIGYLAVQWLWRLHVVLLWRARRKRILAKSLTAS